MKTILVASIIFISSIQITLKEPPNGVLKAFKQKFPSAMNITWIEEDNNIRVTSNFNGKIYKYVQDNKNTWKVNFMLGDRKTSAIFDLAGHWLVAQQEIKFEDIAIKEVSSAIKKDYHDCKILSIKINNSAFYGTSYDVDGKCGDKPKVKFYDYMGFPFPPKI
jgi:hypothetical protein